MRKIVILTGAGISAESGIPTFRDGNGLWENYSIEEVATPQGWHKNPELVLDFYNARRNGVRKAQPNAAHLALAELDKKYDTLIITQNIDDLHERGGSAKVMHLHGEILKARSTYDPGLLYELEGKDIYLGDKCERGYQLRPHVVWFGEAVPMIEKAMEEVQKADLFMVVGTSMAVYPAAGLISYVNRGVPIYLIDPNIPEGLEYPNIHKVQKKASEGVVEVVRQLMDA